MAEEWRDQYDYYFDKMNTMNKDSAKAQMDFQERMSSTAHQREVKDLIAAGLNPVLSVNNGASSPMGAYANVDNSAVSAKFARQNLERELANNRTIAAMNNENAMNIALAQIKANMELGMYQADKSYDASVYNSDMQKAIKELDIENPDSIVEFLIRFFQGGYSDQTGSESGAKSIGSDIIGKLYNLVVGKNNKYNIMKINAAKAGENIRDYSLKWFKSYKTQVAANRAYTAALKEGKSKKEAEVIRQKVRNSFVTTKNLNSSKRRYTV